MKSSDVEIKIQHIGLKKEIHQLDYHIDEAFFANYEHTLINQCQIDIHLSFDKRIEPYVIELQMDGVIQSECDKCSANLPLPIHQDFTIYVKFTGEHHEEDSNESEIIFITRDEPEIDLTKLVYDFIHLSLPVYKICTEEGNTPYCDVETLKAIAQYTEQETEKTDPRWEGLKDLKNKLK